MARPEYSAVSNHALLERIPITTETDEEVFTKGVEVAIGTDLYSDKVARQLNIRFANGRTYVDPIVDNPDGPVERYMYEGTIAPRDCNIHYKMLNPAPITEPVVEQEEYEEEDYDDQVDDEEELEEDPDEDDPEDTE